VTSGCRCATFELAVELASQARIASIGVHGEAATLHRNAVDQEHHDHYRPGGRTPRRPSAAGHQPQVNAARVTHHFALADFIRRMTYSPAAEMGALKVVLNR
jgi:hypothetical protein